MSIGEQGQIVDTVGDNGAYTSPSPMSYTKTPLASYDGGRHISLEDARTLVGREDNLSVTRLDNAIRDNHIQLYTFNETQYLDRFDIGRVYDTPLKSKRGVRVERYFSAEGQNPLDSVEFGRRDLEIKNWQDGTTVFEMHGAEFPKSWNNTSAQIVAQKYFYRPSKPDLQEKLQEKIGAPGEYSLKHLSTRVANFFADEGYGRGYFETEEDRDAFRDELLWLQINQKGAFNSPVQFNAGLFNEYDIEGSNSLNYYRDSETGEVTKLQDAEYVHPQCHACFIIGPRDDLESIANHAVNEVGIFSLGSGVGQDIGKLRGKGERLSGGGVASGPLSYLSYYDNVAGSIKSGGKSRRAARMTTMRYSHADIMDFIRAKVGEDGKALTLIKNGYSTGMDGEAFTTVAFQNTNLSVRLDDSFFEQLKSGGTVPLYSIKGREKVDEIPAERILKEMAFGAWRVGDPGVQYEGMIDMMHTCKNSGRQNSTNPCGEYMFLDDTSCNLASLNFLAFSDDKGNFDAAEFKRAVRIFSIAQDIANDAASYPVRDIAEISPEFRTIGLGYANLGSLLMRKGLAYDSDEARAFTGAATAVLTGAAYEASVELAEHMGPFVHYNFNKNPMQTVIEQHRNNLDGVEWELVSDAGLEDLARTTWDNVVHKGNVHGFRNAQATVIAPTGTISYLMGAQDSTGIEPPISLIINKDLAGGGSIQVANQEVPQALENLGYAPEEIEDVASFIVKRNTVVGAPHIRPDHYPIFATAFGNKEGIGSIPFEGHVRMMGAAQPFVSGGISKTNNYPEHATVKEVYDGFVMGHDLGLKGLTVFRTNSKPISALNFGTQHSTELKRGEKRDLPPERNAFETEVTIGGTPLHIIASEYEDGTPGQITFLSYKEGSTLGALLKTSGVQASKALKRGVELSDVVDGWLGQEFEPKGLVQGHPYIKTALSPLDFAAKALRLEYLGDVDRATEPDNVEVRKLRGATNGAFRTYARKNINAWSFDEVMKDAELGGFVDPDPNALSSFNGNGKDESYLSNARGVSCQDCGNIMRQISSNCYSCSGCGEKIGGCGL